MATGILLDKNNDLLIRGGSFRNGESEIDEVGVILSLNQGNLKNDPLLGPNLASKIRSVNGASQSVAAVKKHLARDGKSYEQLKTKIKLA